MTNPTTDEQAIHAIWELLSEEERDALGLEFVEEWDEQDFPSRTPDRVYWWCWDEGIYIPDRIAHRAILDAAREVLDLAGVSVRSPSKPDINGWWFMELAYIDRKFYPTRTLCTYHALAWLKDAGRQDSGQKGKSE